MLNNIRNIRRKKMKIKNIIVASLLAIGIGVTTLTVYAQAKYETPREALSAITGKTIDEIHTLRFEEGMNHADLFETDAQYEEFKSEVLEQRKDRIDERVEDGRLTQERANEIKNQMNEDTEMFDGRGFGRGGNCHVEGEEFRNHNDNRYGSHHGQRSRGFGHRR